ncbi:ATP-binding cassette domain-containing protein [Nocardioides daejeonensis]|uniref:ATP-binding cassette domain-containing protein n=1 Tax=Nocardioides daejeonensis TaxID=1046556 RepID=UPI000D745219|nr:ATP-binding cassette domain-containing protein [Nocardioides daejeonensis]
MIELREVRFGYDDRTILGGIDLRIDEGELMLLAGPTGVGKSTLLGVVAGLVPGYTGGVLRGDVLLDGVSVIEQPARERAHAIGYVGQNPAAWFVTDTVEEELAYGMEQLGLPPETMRRRVEETLDLLGIADLRHRDLRTLSGGQQQRVAIGAVLTMHPRLLVLDEPTSALDPTAAEDVLATITRLVHDLGLSVLVAEHRLERVVPFADRMCLLRSDGTVLVDEPAAVLADSPIAPPLVELGRLAGWQPLPLSVRDARRRTSSLRSALDRGPAHSPERVPGPTEVEAAELVVAHGRRVVLRGVSLTLHAGRVTALMGRNGSGKSTLLWTLQGRLARTSGRLAVGGADPHQLKREQRRAHAGMVPQTAADLLYLETVAEECAAADQSADAPAGRCAGLLARMAPGIDPATHPRDLSEGQRLALVVAIVLTARPPVLLLDEPTRGLDYAAKTALAAVLAELAELGHAVLLATHDVEFVARVADDVVVLAEGEVVSAGPVRRVVAESPAFAPQVMKVLGPDWLRVDEVASALEAAG